MSWILLTTSRTIVNVINMSKTAISITPQTQTQALYVMVLLEWTLHAGLEKSTLLLCITVRALVKFSLVLRPLPEFISQSWRKIGRRPGTNDKSRTENGGLDSYVMWTWFHNDGDVPTQYAACTPSDQIVKDALPTATDFASIKSLAKDV